MWKKGFVGVAKFGVGLLSVLILVNIFLLCSVSVFSVNSTFDNFTVTPDNISFNWTNGTINITANVDNITIVVGNSSTSIHSNYSQVNLYYAIDDSGVNGIDSYGNLTADNWALCFNTTTLNIMSFVVQNLTNDYVNNVTLNTTNTTLFYLTPYTFCPPGRYWGNFTIYNENNASDYANVTATVVIPISTNNTLNETTHSGFFKGKLPQYPDTYHSYYFNTSLGNATGLTIKLNGYTDDVDLFLFYENGTLISQSINRGSADEEITDVRLPATDTRWEIRVYGNTTSLQEYDGWLFYTVLNVTNTTSPDETVSLLNFGTFNASNTKQLNFTLENEASLNLTNVNQSIEIYHVGRWTNSSNSYNLSTDFTDFFVPSFAQKIKVKLEWEFESGKNITNWTLELRDNGGGLVNTSQNKYLNANATNGTRTEYIVYEGPFNTTEGFWNISIINHTNGSLSLYNVTAYIWVNTSEWLNVTLSNGSAFTNIRFNATGKGNASYNLTANLTIPNSSILNGTYEGFMQYNNSGGWKLRLPVSFDVTAGVLSINNVFNESTYSIRGNMYLNNTRTANISFNNTGGYPIYYNATNSSNTLFYTENSSYYINFTAQLPPNPINADSGGFINITFTLNTSLTGNTEGSYRGWIFFNTTNATSSSQSYPYQTFNLSLEINLSDELDVNITEITSGSSVNVTENATNVTLKIIVALLNGMVISNNDYLTDITNFNSSTSSITNINVTTGKGYTGLTSSVMDSGEFGGVPCSTLDDYCLINVTIPNGTVGGTYNISIPARWSTGEGNLTGFGVNSSFVVNDTGLNVTPLTSKTASKNEGTTWTFNVSVANYGPIEATGRITMYELTDEGGATSVAADDRPGTCASGRSSNYFIMSISENEVCWFTWRVTITNVSSNYSATFNVTAQDNAFNNNITGIVLSIKNLPAADGGTPDTGDGTTPPTVTYTHTMSITDYGSEIYAILGTTNSTTVTVKHAGDVSTMTVKLEVTDISNVSITVSPGSYTLSPDNNGVFNVTFNVSNSTTLGNHSGTFKAYESDDTSNYVTKSFTLIVLSTLEREGEINVSYEDHIVDFENLTAEFERINATGLVSEANLTRVWVLINDTNNTINDIRAAIESGDYAIAESLLAELAGQLNRVRTELAAIQEEEETAAGEFWSSVWVWVIVGIIIAGVGGLLVYMLLPPGEGYHIGYGYKPGGESLWIRIKNKLKHIKGRKKGEVKEGVGAFKNVFKKEKAESVSRYAEGYERREGYDYNYGTRGRAIKQSMKGVKNIFQRRPQKTVYEYAAPAEEVNIKA